MSQPHIVFFLSDQHNPDVIASHGDPWVRTPNLDRLTAGGAVLTNCYCPSPLCVPSRAAMLSGQSPHRTGVYTNWQALPSDQATLAHVLALAGYETVLAGRMHFVGPDQRHGYMRRLVGDITPSQAGPGSAGYGELGGTSGQSRRAAEQSGPGRSPVLQYDEAVVAAACDLLEQRAADDPPLFLTVGLYGPHCPYVCPKDLYDHYYSILPELLDWKGFIAEVHPAVRKWYENRGVLDLDADTVRRVRAAYYGLVELMDGYLGQVLAALDEALGLENTLFIYSSDHGDMIGEKGLFWKTNMYEGSARVPAVYSWPGVIPAGHRVTGLTSLLDLAPTLINLCGAPELPVMDGQDIWLQIMGQAEIDPQRVVFALCGDVKGDMPSAMARRGPWKLVEHHGYDVPQLFNLDDDPRELNDLGKVAEHEGIRQALRAALEPVWDGPAILANAQQMIVHNRLRAQFNQLTGTRFPDEWVGDQKESYLL